MNVLELFAGGAANLGAALVLDAMPVTDDASATAFAYLPMLAPPRRGLMGVRACDRVSSSHCLS